MGNLRGGRENESALQMHFQLREGGGQSARHVQACLPDRETNILEDRAVSVYAGLRGRLYREHTGIVHSNFNVYLGCQIEFPVPPMLRRIKKTQFTRYVAPVAIVSKPDWDSNCVV